MTAEPDGRQLLFNVADMLATVSHEERPCRVCGVQLWLFITKSGGRVAFTHCAERHAHTDAEVAASLRRTREAPDRAEAQSQ